MESVEDVEAGAEYFPPRGSGAFLDQEDSIAFDLGYFVFVADGFDHGVDEHVDGGSAVREFSTRHELGERADVWNQDGGVGCWHGFGEVCEVKVGNIQMMNIYWFLDGCTPAMN